MRQCANTEMSQFAPSRKSNARSPPPEAPVLRLEVLSATDGLAGEGMLLDLSRLRGDVERIDRVYAPDRFSLEDEQFRLVSPVHLGVEVRKDAQTVRLTGRVQATLETDCGRCLDPIKVPVDAPLDLTLLPHSANAGADEREVSEGDLGVSFYKDDVLDLGDVIKEQFYLALPMKPLCREDCRGLCPNCGVNRNRETCSCRTDWVDPRMAPLKKLLDR